MLCYIIIGYDLLLLSAVNFAGQGNEGSTPWLRFYKDPLSHRMGVQTT